MPLAQSERMPRKKKSPVTSHRNAVAVRFQDAQLAAVEKAATDDKMKISPWVRDAAIEKAKGKSK